MKEQTRYEALKQVENLKKLLRVPSADPSLKEIFQTEIEKLQEKENAND